MNLLVINGPNLNKLGSRDRKHYGNTSLKNIELLLNKEFKSFQFTFYQSNIEGEIVSQIQNAPEDFDALIINPGGYAHTSVAIRDALLDIALPKIEVHLSHLVKREDFRQILITAGACDGYISGFRENGYAAAVYLINQIFKEREDDKSGNF